ncbi:MAG: DegT/DnrJ/EryC1/StrS family aminotransferase [Planctomycetota bacterium]
MSDSERTWAVPFNRPDVPPPDGIAAAAVAALESGSLTKGPQLAAFEREAAGVIGTADAVGVSSCTSGLMLVLDAIAGLAAGCRSPQGRRPACLAAAGRTEVILPSFIFLAAPAAIRWAGLEPVFVDVDPRSFTLPAEAALRALSPRTAAILACHTFGCPCDVDGLAAVAARAGVPLVIDAAHGLGSTAAGRQVGRGGLAQVFSLSPTKLVVAGEGGLVATDCACLAEAIRIGREYGNDGAYGCERPGLNARLPELSAALGRASLARLPRTAAARRDAAEAYMQALANVPGIGFQQIPAGCGSSWKDFSIQVGPEAGVSRDGLRKSLAAAGIDTRAYYDPPCHRMEAFQPFAAGALPVTDALSASLLALPMGAHVSPPVAERVAAEVGRIVDRSRAAVTA